MGPLTYRQLAERARAQAAGLDDLGHRLRGTGGDGVSQNSARLLASLFGVSGSGASAYRSTSASTPTRSHYIVEHSGASVLLVDPELEEALEGSTAKRKL